MSNPIFHSSSSLKVLSSQLGPLTGAAIDYPPLSPVDLSHSILNLLAALEGKTIEQHPLVPMKFDDAMYHADKCARKLLLFSCLKWFMDREYEFDSINFCLYADHYRQIASQSNSYDLATFIFGEFIADDCPNQIFQGIRLADKIYANLGNRDPNLFAEVQEDCIKSIKADFYVPTFKHPVFNGFATTVHSLLPALNKPQKIDATCTSRQAGYVLMLMESLETFEAKEQTDKSFTGVDESVSFTLNHAIRRLLTFPLLKEYVDKEVCSENITFWMAVTDYKNILTNKPNITEAEKRQAAEEVFAEYISSGAPSEVNIQHNLRSKIEANMKEAITISLFDAAQREVLQLLHNNSYERFLKSQDYQEFMAKLKSIPVFYSLDMERKRKDEKFREKYKLPSSEQVIVSITCAMEGKNMTLHGALLFSEKFACFHATVFGFKTREVIPLKDVDNLELDLTDPDEYDTDGLIRMTMKDKIYTFRGFSFIRRAYVTVRKLYTRALKLSDASTAEERIVSPRRQTERDANMLTEKDWSLFQEGAKVVAFTKDMPILREGDRSRNLYQIARGRIRVEKNGEVLRTMEEGQFFGEISFLEGSSASATVLADENPTAVYIIDGQFIESLFKVDPGLTGRFYNFLAIQLAERLRSRKVAPTAAVEKKTPKITNEKLQKTFGFPKDEELVSVIPCSYEKMIRQHGTLYVSTNNISFSAQIIGMKTKDVIPLKTLATITANESAIEFTTEDGREFIFTNIEHVKEAYESISNTWRTVKANRNALARNARPSETPRDTSTQGKVEVLSQKDMKMFLSGAKLITFKKDEAVLEEGSRARCLYQIGRGNVRVQKGTGADTVIFRKLGQGQLFGEMSFLQPVPASASIIADEDGVDIYVMERSYVESLLHLDPELPGRFYLFLASNLANRLRK